MNNDTQQIVNKVERRLSVLETVEAEIDHGLKRAARLRQAILKRAFEGKLVPQDPSDEPAAKLLERIAFASHGEKEVRAKAGRNRIIDKKGVAKKIRTC